MAERHLGIQQLESLHSSVVGASVHGEKKTDRLAEVLEAHQHAAGSIGCVGQGLGGWSIDEIFG